MRVEADPRGVASMRRVAMALLLIALVSLVGGVVVGGTVVAGIPVPGPVGSVAGALTAVPAVLVLRWTQAKTGQPALWTEGDTLVLNGQAGPPLRLDRADVTCVGHVRPTAGSIEHVAFGDRVFTMSSGVDVARGVREVPVGSKYVLEDLGAVRELVVAWTAGRDADATDR